MNGRLFVRRMGIGMSSLLCAASLLISSTVTFAAPKPEVPKKVGNSVVLEASPDGAMIKLSPDPALADKSQWNPDKDAADLKKLLRYSTSGRASVEALSPDGTVEPMGCGWPECRPATLVDYKSEMITISGKTRGMNASFSSTVSYPIPETSATFSGRSRTEWFHSPATVTLYDHWHASGLSVTASYPPGVSGSGQDAYDTTSNTNTTAITSYFSNIKFRGVVLYSVSEDATGKFQLGSTSWRITASDWVLI